MKSANVYDNRTLFVKCDCASASQIRKAFTEAVTTYQMKEKINLNCRFRVNLVGNKEGKTFGIAFVFVTNPAVYYMLLGKNPDGSDRIEYRDDPSWSPSGSQEANDSGWSTISSVCNKEVTCPKVVVPLEPLIVLPPYELTPEQIEHKRNKIIEENLGKPGFNPSLVEVPSTSHFVVDRAMAIPVDNKFMPNILKCKNVPDWVTKEDIKLQFAPYATDSETIQERFIKGRKVEETYPFVNINEDRVAFIIFDQSTNDALFALHMMKKTTIIKKTPQGEILSTTLLLGHSFRTDRDLMTDITQKGYTNHSRNNSIKNTVANVMPKRKQFKV